LTEVVRAGIVREPQHRKSSASSASLDDLLGLVSVEDMEHRIGIGAAGPDTDRALDNGAVGGRHDIVTGADRQVAING